MPSASRPVVSLALLGGYQARLGVGSAVTLPTKKAQALLAYLALHQGQPQSRDKLAALLWGEADDLHARQSLRQAVAAIRQALPDLAEESLVFDGDAIEVARGAVEVDARVFEELATDPTTAALEKATALYRGDLLEGFGVREAGFDEWLAAERLRLRELAIDVLGRLVAHQIEARRTEQALHHAVRLLAMDPLQEATHRTVMSLYARLGRRGAAARQYQACAEMLRREFKSRPEAETERLYQEIVKGEDARARPRILVVEDEATTRTLLEGLLTPAGYDVAVAADGADALLQLSRTLFDLVIADIRMPLLDGLKLIEIMKSKRLDTPVIFVTAKKESEARALRLGAADYIVKPIQKDALLQRVRKALRAP